MTGFDIFLAVLVVIAVAIQTRRGFGRAIFDLLAVYSALLGTSTLTPIIAHSIQGVGTSGTHYAVCEIVTFLSLSLVLLTISRLTANSLLWNLGMFDTFGGLVIGSLFAVVFCHGIVAALSVGDTQQATLVSGGFSQQLLTFGGVHQFVDGVNSSIATHPDS